MTDSKKKVLFLCTGNSCRSQMGEGLLRHLAGTRYESCSAGSKPSGYVHPMAIEVMAEVGIDIGELKSKSINEFLPPNSNSPDLILSVCNSAKGECPVFPGDVERIHIPFYDPADAEGTEDEKRDVFRRVRDEIRNMILERFVKQNSNF